MIFTTQGFIAMKIITSCPHIRSGCSAGSVRSQAGQVQLERFEDMYLCQCPESAPGP